MPFEDGFLVDPPLPHAGPGAVAALVDALDVEGDEEQERQGRQWTTET